MKYLPCYTSPIKGRWRIAPTSKLLVTDASEMFHTSSSGVGVGVQTLTSMSEAWNGCFIDTNQNRHFCPGEVQFFTGTEFSFGIGLENTEKIPTDTIHRNTELGYNSTILGCDFFRKYTDTQIRIGGCAKVFPLHTVFYLSAYLFYNCDFFVK